MHAYLSVPSAQQSLPASFVSAEGADALYGCVDWFLYQPPDPGRADASTECAALNAAGPELAVSY